MKKLLTSTVIAVAASSVLVAGGGIAEAKAREFANCTAMHKVYKHGVGKPHAHDSTSSTPVTNFKHSLPLYNANTKSDRDKDGIACEA